MWVLVGYLPIHTLDNLTGTQDQVKQYKWAMFHTTIKVLMWEIQEAIKNRGWEFICRDGYKWWCMPSVGSYTADHPEQCTIACTNKDHCPKYKAYNLSANKAREA